MAPDTETKVSPPSYTPENVFEVWARLTPKDIALVQWCLHRFPGLTVGECLLHLDEMGGI